MKAKQYCYNSDELREREACLFGSAAGKQSSQSKLRIRLQATNGATLSWSNSPEKPLSNPSLAEVYVGYGPVQKNQVLSAISVQQTAKLSLIIADDVDEEDIRQTIALCHQFGTLGSRARNGWGSIDLGEHALPPVSTLPLIDWQSAFDRDWPHGIGTRDGRALIWKTSEENSWKELMGVFSGIRKEQVNKIVSNNMRPCISYPVAKNNKFDGNYRLPSQLVFKARCENKKYVGYIVHLPHGLPDQGDISTERLLDAWGTIHEALDSHKDLSRLIEKAGTV